MIELASMVGGLAGGASLAAWWSALECRSRRTLLEDLRDGRDCERMGEWEGALKYYGRVAATRRGRQRPFANQALFAIGRVHFKQREFRKAARCFSRLHGRRVPGELQAHALTAKARCFEHLQLHGQARTSYRELCTRFPKSALAASAKKEFHRLGQIEKRRHRLGEP